jgi:hypothetical protein
VRPENQDWAVCLTEYLFRYGAEKQLAHASSSMCANDEKVGVLLPDDLTEFWPQLAVPNDEFVLNAAEGAGSSEPTLQVRGFARYYLLTSSNGTGTGDSKSQRGHHVRQAEFRSIKSSE